MMEGKNNPQRRVILYILFGILTTIVNMVVYWAVKRYMNLSALASSIVAWLAAVTFAYVTNRNLVFQSNAHTAKQIISEALRFYISRLATGVIDWLGMWLLVDMMRVGNDVILKFVMNVIVIVLNYLASKLIVFKKPSDN